MGDTAGEEKAAEAAGPRLRRGRADSAGLSGVDRSHDRKPMKDSKCSSYIISLKVKKKSLSLHCRGARVQMETT